MNGLFVNFVSFKIFRFFSFLCYFILDFLIYRNCLLLLLLLTRVRLINHCEAVDQRRGEHLLLHESMTQFGESCHIEISWNSTDDPWITIIILYARVYYVPANITHSNRTGSLRCVRVAQRSVCCATRVDDSAGVNRLLLALQCETYRTDPARIDP